MSLPVAAITAPVPYRVDIRNARDDAFDRLIELGALDAECVQDGVAAVMPDGVVRSRRRALLHAAPASGSLRS